MSDNQPLDTVARIGKNLAKFRGNVPKLQLEKKSGVTRQTIARIESGIGEPPTMRTLMKLAEALGVSTEDLIYG